MKKRHMITVLLLLTVLAVAVCNLPWPSRVDFSMDAAEVRADGTVIGEGELEMKGWVLNYLYKPDLLPHPLNHSTAGKSTHQIHSL